LKSVEPDAWGDRKHEEVFAAQIRSISATSWRSVTFCQLPNGVESFTN
jgi:hypothetical protein